MIRHTVVFRLKHAVGSAAEAAFLADAKVLAGIPGVMAGQSGEEVRDKGMKC